MASDKEGGSDKRTSSVLHASGEKFSDGHNANPVTPKKVFKPRFPYLWIFGRYEEEEKSDGDVPRLNASCQPFDNHGLKNGSCDSNDSFSHDTVTKDDSPVLYYGVSLPSGALSTEEDDDPLVFTDKEEVLRAVKKYKGARFKAFSKEEDALAFASQPADEICPTPTLQAVSSPQVPENEKAQGIVVEKPNPFRAPKSQDMVKLRKAIENGDEEYFMETVWSNPRYLISSCDTPAIMQEGFRYNGLHVAAKHKQPKMCQLILQTIENPKFMELLYSEDSEESRAKRIRYVTDLYLNTPDKGLCETPLHFACKFGCFEAAELLAFHPDCDKNRRNKYNLLAKEIICERCPSSSHELKQKIEDVFKDHYFVPVMRSDGNSVQPVIGEPYSPDNPKVPYSRSPVTNPASPLNPSLSVVAVAGPMSPEDATDFYHMWRTPPGTVFISQDSSKLNRVRLCDPEKGLERIGRYLAQSMKTQWMEYWPSLNAWCDLSSESGMQKLEERLKNLYSQISSKMLTETVENKNEFGKVLCSQNCSNQLSSDHGSSPVLSKPSNSRNLSSASSESSGISQLCHRLEDFHLSDSEDSLLKTSPDMPRVLKSHCDPFQLYKSPLNSSHGDIFMNKNHRFSDVLNEEHSFASGMADKLNVSTETSINMENESFFFKAKNTLHKNEHKISTPKVTHSVNSSLLEKDKQPQTDINRSAFIAVKNIVQSLLEVFSELLMNPEASVMFQTTLHNLLFDDVIPHVKCLHKIAFMSNSEKRTAHCDIAAKVYKEIQESFMYHEIKLITRYLATYLESKFSNASSDDELSDNRTQLFIKPKCLSISNNAIWKQLMCILIFLYGFLSNNEHINDISIVACQCNWENSENVSKIEINEEMDKQKSLRDDSISSDDSSDEEYITPPTSPENSSRSSTPEDPSTPDEGLEVYIDGSVPSKADADILRVVENVNVDPVRFPHLSRWKHLMSSFDKQVIESWPSPSRLNFHQKTIRNKSRTPCRRSPIFPPEEICISSETFTPHRKPRARPLLRRALDVERFEKFLSLEEKE